MKAHPSQSYTLASRSKSRHIDQNYPKSMPAPRYGGEYIAAKFIELRTKDKNGQYPLIRNMGGRHGAASIPSGTTSACHGILMAMYLMAVFDISRGI